MPPRAPAVIASLSLLALAAGWTHAAVPLAPVAAAGTALAQAAQDAPQGVILDLRITRTGTAELTPSLRVPLGSEASVEAAPGVTVRVSQVALNGKFLTLRIGVSETMPQGLMVEGLATVDVPLDKPVTLHIGNDPARPWVLEFTPRVTPAPTPRAPS